MKRFVYSIVLLALYSLSYAGNKDTSKVRYDLNDPRNPDCPCHKYQQQADEEYGRQLGNEAVQKAARNLGGNISSVRKEKAAIFIAKASTGTRADFLKNADKSGHKKRIGRHLFSKRSAPSRGTTLPKKRKVRFGKKDGARCTHW